MFFNLHWGYLPINTSYAESASNRLIFQTVEFSSPVPSELLVIHPHDRGADWEVQLTAAVQHPGRVSYCKSLAQEEV